MKMKHKREFKKYSICPVCGGKDKDCGYCHGKFFVLVERILETDVSEERYDTSREVVFPPDTPADQEPAKAAEDPTAS